MSNEKGRTLREEARQAKRRIKSGFWKECEADFSIKKEKARILKQKKAFFYIIRKKKERTLRKQPFYSLFLFVIKIFLYSQSPVPFPLLLA